MKNFLFENDKSTMKDELFLLFFILVWATAGVLLVVFSPSIWIIPDSMTKTAGILCILVAIIFTPGLIYRLFTNDTH